MTTATALDQLRDTIRREVIAEMVGRLEEVHRATPAEDSAYFDGYRAGLEDAISTIEGE